MNATLFLVEVRRHASLYQPCLFLPLVDVVELPRTLVLGIELLGVNYADGHGE